MFVGFYPHSCWYVYSVFAWFWLYWWFPRRFEPKPWAYTTHYKTIDSFVLQKVVRMQKKSAPFFLSKNHLKHFFFIWTLSVKKVWIIFLYRPRFLGSKHLVVFFLGAGVALCITFFAIEVGVWFSSAFADDMSGSQRSMHCLPLNKDPTRALSIASCCCRGLSWLLERFSSRESLETASIAFLSWWGMCSYSSCWKICADLCLHPSPPSSCKSPVHIPILDDFSIF